MKKTLFLVFVLVLSLLCSCYSTKEMVENPVVTDTEKTIGQKMDELGFPRATIRNMECYFDGPDWVDRFMELLQDAKDYVIITSFLVSECEANEQVYDLLCKRAEEGLQIYFVYDSAAAMDMTESRFHMKPVNRLAHSGVHVLEYNPFTFNRASKLAGMLIREHRKIYIIDGKTVAVGGMNLNYISNRSYLDDGQRDSMFCFESEEAAQILLQYFAFTDTAYRYDEEEIPQLFYIDNIKYDAKSDTLSGAQYMISRQIVREHDAYSARRGCRIYVENIDDGQGSRFVFTLPVVS